MPEFLRLLAPQEAREMLFSQAVARLLTTEVVPTRNSLSRVLAEDVRAEHPLPEFRRSTVDGYAVRAQDTYGASDSLPAYLKLVGEIGMGTAARIDLPSTACVLIHTGGMLPADATAVVMLEHTQLVDAGHGIDKAGSQLSEVEILRAVADGENVIEAGEDVKAGTVVLRRGTRLRAAEIGGLAALGIVQVPVVAAPTVGIISTGDEVVPPDARPSPGQVRDVNAYALAALIQGWGGKPLQRGIVKDQHDLLLSAARDALEACDVLLISGGSSASARDITVDIIASLGAPGVLVHGINVKPGKPTILGVCDGKVVIGLPGNPVSAYVISYLLLQPLLSRLLGLDPQPRPTVRAKLAINLASQAGREDWWPVVLKRSDGDDPRWIADPVFGKSNLIFSLAAGNGLLRIPGDATGLSAGEKVEIELF